MVEITYRLSFRVIAIPHIRFDYEAIFMSTASCWLCVDLICVLSNNFRMRYGWFYYSATDVKITEMVISAKGILLPDWCAAFLWYAYIMLNIKGQDFTLIYKYVGLIYMLIAVPFICLFSIDQDESIFRNFFKERELDKNQKKQGQKCFYKRICLIVI